MCFLTKYWAWLEKAVPANRRWVAASSAPKRLQQVRFFSEAKRKTSALQISRSSVALNCARFVGRFG